jgi:hypothetical protein
MRHPVDAREIFESQHLSKGAPTHFDQTREIQLMLQAAGWGCQSDAKLGTTPDCQGKKKMRKLAACLFLGSVLKCRVTSSFIIISALALMGTAICGA